MKRIIILFLIVFFAVASVSMVFLMFYYGFNDDFDHAYMCSSSSACLLVTLFMLVNLFKNHENK